MAEGDNRVLQDYALPQALGITSSIVSLTVEANDDGDHPIQPVEDHVTILSPSSEVLHSQGSSSAGQK